ARSADGKRLAAVTQTSSRSGAGGGPGPGGPGGGGGLVATMTVWDVATGKRLRTRESEHPRFTYVNYGAFSPDLRYYFIGKTPMSVDGIGPQLDVPDDWEATQASVSRDGRLVAQVLQHQLNDGRGTLVARVMVHEVVTGKTVFDMEHVLCGPIAFMPD